MGEDTDELLNVVVIRIAHVACDGEYPILHSSARSSLLAQSL